jgi:hypothetical protein
MVGTHCCCPDCLSHALHHKAWQHAIMIVGEPLPPLSRSVGFVASVSLW